MLPFFAGAGAGIRQRPVYREAYMEAISLGIKR